MKTVKLFKLLILTLILCTLFIPFGGAGAAGPFTAIWDEPVDVTVYNPCNDEWVWLTGTMHRNFHLTVTSSFEWKAFHENFRLECR